MKRATRWFRCLVCALAGCGVAAFGGAREVRGQASLAVHETVLDAFPGHRGGSGPAGLVAGPDGSLYGATTGGGNSSCGGGCGTVYALTPPVAPTDGWRRTILYAFKNYADGNGPYATLVMDKAGALYGTTSGVDGGVGTAFRLSRPHYVGDSWQKTVLHTFARGAYPLSALAFGSRGELYGTTFNDPDGTVYELAPPTPETHTWRYSLVHAFTRAEGTGLMDPVVVDASGALYGVARYGGTPCINGCGSVFKLEHRPPNRAAWTLSVLYEFRGPPGDGQGPAGALALDRDGSLFGVTSAGGRGLGNYGTIYRLEPPSAAHPAWSEHIVYDFNGYAAGSSPIAGLIPDGNRGFYGTAGGGDYKWLGNGTVFHVTPRNPDRTAWNESVLFGFGGKAGLFPNSLMSFGTALYGTTGAGGRLGKPCAPIGCGTVFRLTL